MAMALGVTPLATRLAARGKVISHGGGMPLNIWIILHGTRMFHSILQSHSPGPHDEESGWRVVGEEPGKKC
jgi:hypothetical protein